VTDQIVPNVLVVNSDGSISAALTGNLRLPADTVSGFWVAQQRHSVYWVNTRGALVAANSGAVDTSGRSEAMQAAYTPAQDAGATMTEQASTAAGGSYVRAEAWGPAGDNVGVVITSDGKSSFPQLRTGLGRVVFSDKFVWQTPILGPGGKAQANIPHLLGTTNIVVVASLFDFTVNNPSAGAWSWIQDGQDNNNVVVEVQAVGAAAIRVHWQGFVVGFLA
jgi:hypothetical protein